MIKSLVIISLIHFSNGIFPKLYNHLDANLRVGDAGEPLILTPLLEAGKIEEAQTAAQVNLADFGDVKSFAGYFTVDKLFDSNLFFWFFPSETDYENAPVILWLQGGPGSSSMFGLFGENGPFIFRSQNEIDLREHRWSKTHSLLYFDNPVGTGFSFTRDGYALNQTKVGADLFEALQQFFTMFPEIQKNGFFITGESYAGKYIPALGYTILKKNPEALVKINLQGMAIGNGLSDPENQFRYADYLYQHGFVDINVRNAMDELENEISHAIRMGEYQRALELLDEDFNGVNSFFSNATGYKNVYNYLYPIEEMAADKYMAKFFQRADVRAAINVGNATFDGSPAGELLQIDIPKSIVPWVIELLNHYRILFYSGQLDIIVAYPMMVSYLQKLKFSSAKEYATAPRHTWMVGNDLAGYVKTAGNLSEVLIRNAGHLAPMDQPEWSLDLITKFVRKEPLSGLT